MYVYLVSIQQLYGSLTASKCTHFLDLIFRNVTMYFNTSIKQFFFYYSIWYLQQKKQAWGSFVSLVLVCTFSTAKLTVESN